MKSRPITRRAAAIRLVLAAILVSAIGHTNPGAAVTRSASNREHGHDRPTIVLVHGSFADASGFNDVIHRLQARGYPTIAPSNPLRGLASDAAYVRSVLNTIDGPIVLVAHSYGGMVITNAATGDRDVKALVYINGFAPAEGETAGALLNRFPGSMITLENLTLRPYPTTNPTQAGLDAYINIDVFREAFAADVNQRMAAAMAATQRPIDLAVLEQPSAAPAWETTPSWFILGTGDHIIPPELHRFMAERADAVRTVEVRASHVVMMSKPAAVVGVIVEAARH
jgi:pimeloyl-ACP methyl ester carboxylesterase